MVKHKKCPWQMLGKAPFEDPSLSGCDFWAGFLPYTMHGIFRPEPAQNFLKPHLQRPAIDRIAERSRKPAVSVIARSRKSTPSCTGKDSELCKYRKGYSSRRTTEKDVEWEGEESRRD